MHGLFQRQEHVGITFITRSVCVSSVVMVASQLTELPLTYQVLNACTYLACFLFSTHMKYGMPACNDPTCPLNRQGVGHEMHEGIERQEITHQCNDPRCAMNRMGTIHNAHDKSYAGMQNPQKITEEQHDLPRSDEQIPTKSRPPADFTIKREWPNPQEFEQLARHQQRMKVKQEEAKAREQAKNETDDVDVNDALYELLRNISKDSQESQGRPTGRHIRTTANHVTATHTCQHQCTNC